MTPLYVAVRVTVVLAVTAAAVTVKLAEDAPAATVTDAGVVNDPLLSASVTLAPPDGAAPLRATTHVRELAPVRDAGQTSDESCGPADPSTRLAPATVTGLPLTDDPNAPVRASVVVLLAPVPVADTLATTPAGIAFAFNPATRHVYAPDFEEHDRLFSAAASAGPAVMFIDATAEVGYCIVH